MSIEEIIGRSSFIIICIAGLFHCTRVWQGKIIVSPISWLIWLLTGIALFVSYRSLGATYNLYPVYANIIFPGINFFLSLKQKFTKLDKWDWACCIFGICSIILWYYTYQDPDQVKYANYLAIVADLCALIPTYRIVKADPMSERPLSWILFSFAFGICIFAITEDNLANYILPIYMFLGAGYIAYLQIRYRIKNQTGLWY